MTLVNCSSRVARRVATLTTVLVALVFLPSAAGAFTEQQKLTANDGAPFDHFGGSVAIAGNRAIVGADNADVDAPDDNKGAAYVFSRSGSVWTLEQKLTANDGVSGDRFGASVAISGSTAIVGAPNDSFGTNTQQGSAYVFVRSVSGVWTQQQKLIASDGSGGDHFGRSVAIGPFTAVVGAESDDVVTLNDDRGSAYVFSQAGTVWSEHQKLTASDGANSDFFGISVALSVDTAVVGAYLGNGAQADQGSAYVFLRSSGTWTEQAELTASDGAPGDQFGLSVAVDADTAVIGAPADDIDLVGDNRGSAHVFVRSSTVWSLQQKLVATDRASGDQFGASVAIHGDTGIIGARSGNGAAGDQGAVYPFSRSGTVWSEEPKLTASDGDVADNFGLAVSVSNDTIIVGALGDEIGSNTDQGSAYVFVPGAPTAVLVRALTATRTEGGIVVRWRTATEREMLGFNLYRQRQGKLVKLNRTLIPSVFGGTTSNHSYSFLDRSARPGSTYTYRLQAVSLGGTRAWLGTAVARR